MAENCNDKKPSQIPDRLISRKKTTPDGESVKWLTKAGPSRIAANNRPAMMATTPGFYFACRKMAETSIDNHNPNVKHPHTYTTE